MNNIPTRYIPKVLTTKDTKKQKAYIKKSRKLYKKGIYFNRPSVKSYKTRKSNHVNNAKRIYKVDTVVPNKAFARKTQCSLNTLKKIVNKGRGAYYSSGSRPNQSAESWGLARLGSALTGGYSSVIDFHLLHKGCNHNGKAYKMAKKTCKNMGRCSKQLDKIPSFKHAKKNKN
jgi:hypothetical protein|tara:strand:- start:3703 stop:4221 length:519 start_codon:yes stop_codon:yes gene_type:complete